MTTILPKTVETRTRGGPDTVRTDDEEEPEKNGDAGGDGEGGLECQKE